MKTIANIIIIKSQCPIRTSVSNPPGRVPCTEVANTGLPKLPLDDLKSLRHQLVELHVIQV